MPPTIRQEVEHLILLNYCEQWVDAVTAFKNLEKHGDHLIPGLVDCLDDPDEEIRLYAVQLLDAAEFRAEVALPTLSRMVSDPDQNVRLTATNALRKFGTKAQFYDSTRASPSPISQGACPQA